MTQLTVIMSNDITPNPILFYNAGLFKNVFCVVYRKTSKNRDRIDKISKKSNNILIRFN